MSIFKESVNEYLSVNITNTKSPRSVAKAYKTYLADKTKIISDFILMVSQAVTIEENDSMTRMSITDEIENIIVESGYTTDRLVVGPSGEVVRLVDLMQSVSGDELNPMIHDKISNGMVEAHGIINGLVDSFQSAKVFESAFAVIEISEDQVTASVADIVSRVQTLGFDITSNTSNVMTMVGDIMSDASSNVLGKISQLNSLITIGTEVIDDDDYASLVIPDFNDEGYEGTSPFGAMMNDVDLRDLMPSFNIVKNIKTAAKLTKSLFNKTKNLVAKGYEMTKNFVDKTFVNPIDFSIINEKSDSHMVDHPINGGISFNINTLIEDEFDAFKTSGFPRELKPKLLKTLTDMRVGSMISTYTPFSVQNFVRDDADNYRLLIHIIPTAPISYNPGRYIDDMGGKYGFSDPTGSHILPFPDAGRSFLQVYKDYILSGGGYNFNQNADDDAYYFRALSSSIFRLSLLSGMVNLSITDTEFINVNPDYTLDEVEDVQMFSADSPNSGYIYATGSYMFPGAYDDNWNSLEKEGWFDYDIFEWFEDSIKDTIEKDEVTNRTFMDMLNGIYGDAGFQEIRIIFQMLAMASLNKYDIMSDLYTKEGTIPAFLPTIQENEYQIPMYGINSDSKNGQKVAKVFKGIIITAVVVTVGVFAIKGALKLKHAMNMRSLRLSGLQRVVENMDPTDPNYAENYRTFIKARRKFNKQNKFLGMIGLGAKKNASNAFSGDFNLEEFIPSNKEIIDLLH